MRKREMFAEVVIEKLLTYAIGRGLDHNDMPLVRSLTHNAAKDNFRFSSLLMGVVQSPGLHHEHEGSDARSPAAVAMRGD